MDGKNVDLRLEGAGLANLAFFFFWNLSITYLCSRAQCGGGSDFPQSIIQVISSQFISY